MEINELLGQKTDSAIARMAGVSHTAVGKRRRKKGIPPAKPQRGSRFNWAAWDHLLGTMPDLYIAKMIECSRRTVQRRRQALGIEPCFPPAIIAGERR